MKIWKNSIRTVLMIAAVSMGLLCFESAAGEKNAGVNKQYYFQKSRVYTYEEMSADLSVLQMKYDSVMTMDSLDTTYDGRKLFHIVIGDRKAERQVLVFGSIHGREYITSQLVMCQLADILERLQNQGEYKGETLSHIFNRTALHIIPMINPDGVTLCQRGMEAMKFQKTRQQLYRIYEMDQAVELDEYFGKWKSNARGVDLNRNFDAKWEEYDDRTGHPSSDHYKGSFPESEIEAKALTELTRQYPFQRTISYHAQGNVIYWYFGQEGDLYRESREFAELVAKETGYVTDADYDKLDPAGYKDWAISAMKIPSLTVEVGTGGTPVSAEQFPTIWEQNKTVLLEMMYDLYQE